MRSCYYPSQDIKSSRKSRGISKGTSHKDHSKEKNELYIFYEPYFVVVNYASYKYSRVSYTGRPLSKIAKSLLETTVQETESVSYTGQGGRPV